jgi:hypothetical protein
MADSEIDGIGFRDLIELRFVRTFVACGVPQPGAANHCRAERAAR